MRDSWKDIIDEVCDKNRPEDTAYQQRLYDLLNQASRQPLHIESDVPETKILVKELEDQLLKAKILFEYLTKQTEIVNNPLNFLYAIDEDLDEKQDWCFENDLIFKVIVEELIDIEVQIILFKTEEDATAFKLRWI